MRCIRKLFCVPVDFYAKFHKVIFWQYCIKRQDGFIFGTNVFISVTLRKLHLRKLRLRNALPQLRKNYSQDLFWKPLILVEKNDPVNYNQSYRVHMSTAKVLQLLALTWAVTRLHQ